MLPEKLMRFEKNSLFFWFSEYLIIFKRKTQKNGNLFFNSISSYGCCIFILDLSIQSLITRPQSWADLKPLGQFCGKAIFNQMVNVLWDLQFGLVGDSGETQQWRLTAVSACLDLIQFAIVHRIRDAVKKLGNGSVGSVTRNPPLGCAPPNKSSSLHLCQNVLYFWFYFFYPLLSSHLYISYF